MSLLVCYGVKLSALDMINAVLLRSVLESRYSTADTEENWLEFN